MALKKAKEMSGKLFLGLCTLGNIGQYVSMLGAAGSLMSDIVNKSKIDYINLVPWGFAYLASRAALGSGKCLYNEVPAVNIYNRQAEISAQIEKLEGRLQETKDGLATRLNDLTAGLNKKNGTEPEEMIVLPRKKYEALTQRQSPESK